jgi:hypothetical protein
LRISSDGEGSVVATLLDGRVAGFVVGAANENDAQSIPMQTKRNIIKSPDDRPGNRVVDYTRAGIPDPSYRPVPAN